MNKDKLLINGLLFAGVYLLFGKPILDFLGVTKGQGVKDFEQLAQSANNPFSVDFWRNYFYGSNAQPKGRKPLTNEMLTRLREAANLFYYGFHAFGEDEETIVRAVMMCKSKAEISLMSNIIQDNYGGNMLSLIRYGKTALPNGGLSNSEMTIIFNRVKSLPNS